MIKPNELRIGNYVQIKENILDYGKTGEVIQFDLMNFYGLEKGYSNEDCFEGIPITEEWLLKFGFEESRYQGDLTRGKIVYYKE